MTLEEYRLEKGMSYQELATLCGLHKSTIWNYCAGTREPTLRYALIIYRVTNHEVKPLAEDWGFGDINGQSQRRDRPSKN